MKGKFSALFSTPALIRRVLLSWLTSVSIAYCVIPRSLQNLQALDALQQMWLPAVLIMGVIFFSLLCILAYFWNMDQLERWFFLPVFSILAFFSLRSSFHFPFFIACLFILGFLFCYAIWGWNPSAGYSIKPQKAHRIYPWMLAVSAILFVVFVSIWTVSRVLSFSTPTYDFGIFSQMFYNMKTSGLPMTTVERDGLLSHFHVHVSPIYYLLLPFYWLVPEPATLQVLQAIVLVSAVIPLWKICRGRSLHPLASLLVCLMLLVYPAYSGGTSYDIHENAFLAPLILWLLYSIERKSSLLTILFSLLTLFVKEDAAVYVAVIGLYVFLNGILHAGQNRRWGIGMGIGIITGSILWFLYVTGFIASRGDGVMTYRYQNFMYDGSGSLVSVIKAVILCPMKALYECVDREKLSFIGLTLLPLLGLPLFTRRYERYLLLIPYILVNLMSDYQYQHDIFFQYTFGSVACLFYLTVLNISDLKVDWIRVPVLLAALAIGTSLFCTNVLPKAKQYHNNYQAGKTHYASVRETLSLIPGDASVSATTFYTTYLSQRQVLYDVKYASTAHILSTEYVVLAPNSKTNYTNYSVDGENGYENLTQLLTDNGFEVWQQNGSAVLIYKQTK